MQLLWLPTLYRQLHVLLPKYYGSATPLGLWQFYGFCRGYFRSAQEENFKLSKIDNFFHPLLPPWTMVTVVQCVRYFKTSWIYGPAKCWFYGLPCKILTVFSATNLDSLIYVCSASVHIFQWMIFRIGGTMCLSGGNKKLFYNPLLTFNWIDRFIRSYWSS